jgi:hypothetical protein
VTRWSLRALQNVQRPDRPEVTDLKRRPTVGWMLRRDLGFLVMKCDEIDASEASLSVPCEFYDGSLTCQGIPLINLGFC